MSSTPFQIISSIIFDFLALIMFRPWGVGGIVNKLFRHGHSMTIILKIQAQLVRFH